jgi:hypothetical protein
MRSYVYWIRGKEFAEMAARSVETIKKIDPFIADRQIHVLTDDQAVLESQLFGFGTSVNLIHTRHNLPTMAERAAVYCEFVLNAPLGEEILFLDADALLVKPFPWHLYADLYLTYRTHVNGDEEMAKSIPYNGGVIGVRSNSITKEAFCWLKHRILRMAPQHQNWNGDQLALAELAGAPRGELWSRELRWTHDQACGNGFGVRALPCDTWNYSPDALGEDISTRGIVHLKGGRKGMFEHYATRILGEA